MLLKACTYYVEILNSFNPKLELKDAEFSIKKRLKKILSELRGFKLVATLVLVFKKIESQDKTKWHFSLKLKSRNNYQWLWDW